MIFIQVVLLLLIALVIGCIVGCLLRRWFSPTQATLTSVGTTGSPQTRSDQVTTTSATSPPAEVKNKVSDSKTNTAAGAKDAESQGTAKEVAEPKKETVSKPATKRSASAPSSKASPKRTGRKQETSATKQSATAPTGSRAKSSKKSASAGEKTKSATTSSKRTTRKSAKGAASSNKAASATDKSELTIGPDNLQKIRGVGKVNEQRLNKLGITTFADIAAWKKADVERVDEALSFKGRIDREDWVGQANKLAKGEETEFSERVAKGRVSTSKAKPN
ncbi:MAG: hypothetical protein AAF468_09295 [Pseudomonadota bacterium]